MDLSIWTAEQLRQASAAIFWDNDLSFASPSLPSARPAHFTPLRPPVHHESETPLDFAGLSVVGGLDISFREDGTGEEGVAVLAVLSFPGLKLLTKVSRVISLRATPYVPSFLSFREAAPLASLLEDLRATGSPVPQVLFVDGNGRFHVRQAGSAVAIGLLADLPTVGVAKEYHPTPSAFSPPCDTVNDFNLPYPPDFRLTQKGMRSACRSLLTSRGDWIGLTDSHGEYLGAAVLSSPSSSSTNPVFISSGHRLSLETCVRLSLACSSTARVPEPIRQADALGREEVRKIWGRKMK